MSFYLRYYHYFTALSATCILLHVLGVVEPTTLDTVLIYVGAVAHVLLGIIDRYERRADVS